MPVTKTANRALRGSRRKESVNKFIVKNLEIAIRLAKKGKSVDKILKAISLSDRAAKKHTIHKNKASRIKSQLSKLLPKKLKATKDQSVKKSKPSAKPKKK